MRSEALRRLAALVCLLSLAGCYDGDPSDFREAVVVGREGVTALAIDGEVPVLEVGATLRLRAIATTDTGTADLSDEASWRSSNPAAVMVDRNGVITAVGNGSADISAELAQYGDTVTVLASDAALTAITVTGDAAVDECGNGDYAASGHYDDGSDRDITSLVAWSSTDAAVGRMSTLPGERQRLLSLQAGTTGVQASRGGVVSPAFMVTVADNLDAIDVTPDTLADIPIDAQRQFTAMGTWGAVSGDVTRNSTWSVASDDPDATVATILNGDGGAGLLTAREGGGGTVTGQCGGQQDSVAITVVYLDSLAITNARPVTVVRGGTVLLVLEGTYSDGSVLALNERATWSTTTGSGVTVSNVAGTRGQVTAGSTTGVWTVTATVEGISVSVSVQVTN